MVSIADDWQGQVQSQILTHWLHIDALPPSIAIRPTVLTTAQQLPYTGAAAAGRAAFATDADRTRLWTAMPPLNPLNSAAMVVTPRPAPSP